MFSTVPQPEVSKGLSWRDDGTYPQMGPQLKQWAEPWSHGNYYVTMAMKQLIW